MNTQQFKTAATNLGYRLIESKSIGPVKFAITSNGRLFHWFENQNNSAIYLYSSNASTGKSSYKPQSIVPQITNN